MGGAAGSSRQEAVALFRQKAPQVMAQLMADFVITPTEAAAILGNIGHECAGFTTLQEVSPTVAGSRGGWGWCQWTGPRRRAFEAYCKRSGRDPASDAANYAWLFVELKGSEAGALKKLRSAVGLDSATIVFCRAFLRPGIAHMQSRIAWAKIAMDAWKAARPAAPVPLPRHEREDVAESALQSANDRRVAKEILISAATAATGLGTTAVVVQQEPEKVTATGGDWALVGFGLVALVALGGLFIWLQAGRQRLENKLLKAAKTETNGGRQ